MHSVHTLVTSWPVKYRSGVATGSMLSNAEPAAQDCTTRTFIGHGVMGAAGALGLDACHSNSHFVNVEHSSRNTSHHVTLFFLFTNGY